MKGKSTLPLGLVAVVAVVAVVGAGYLFVQQQADRHREAAARAAGRASKSAPSVAQTKAKGDEAPNDPPVEPQQAVVVHFPLSGGNAGSADEIARLQELELALEKAITSAKTGEVDGNDVGEGEYLVFTYGPDADKLFRAMQPVLQAAKLPKGGFVVKRYGDDDDENAPEQRVDF